MASEHGIVRRSGTRTEAQRQADLKKIDAYRSLEDKVRAIVAEGDFSGPLFDLTTRLLSLNPEYYTIWNVRRRCLVASLFSKPAESSDKTNEDANLQESDRQLLTSELEFTVPLLMKFPKCYWVWTYRQWTLQQAVRRLESPAACSIWDAELDLASKMLDRDQRNFHAWDYRRLLVQKLESTEFRGASMVEDEFAYTHRMIHKDLSNFSAWHHRSQLIFRLLRERASDDEQRATFLSDGLNQVRRGLDLGPEDQSLWYYHQFLISQIAPGPGQRTIVPELTDMERITYLQHEIDEIKDLAEDYKSTKLIYEALLECTGALGRLDTDIMQHPKVMSDVWTWLARLKSLDPMRLGRWDDVERSMVIA